MDYRYGSHTVFKIEYHFVCVMKYRYKTSEWNIRGRTASYPAAPAQIPACETTAPGSSKLLASHIDIIAYFFAFPRSEVGFMNRPFLSG